MKVLPNFSFEKKLWKKGYQFVAGVDEVGRGCFAGPVVAGCVLFRRVTRVGEPQGRGPVLVSRWKGLGADERQDPPRIDDSKKLTPRQRERADKYIKENALAWGIGEVSAQKINRIGMGKAARMAFRKSISEARKRLEKPIDFLLADAFFISYVPGLPARRRKNKRGRFYKKVNGRQQAIVNGDEKSVSIAAASIIAKVYRDKLMRELSKRPKYRKYGWGRNKGYGTQEHQNAIKRYGITRQHRKAYVETWQRNYNVLLSEGTKSKIRDGE